MAIYRDKKRPHLSAKGLSFGVVVARFNDDVTERLTRGAQKTLTKEQARRVDLVQVPGSFEIPFVLKKLARQKKYDALIALGAVIQGETPHFDYVASEAARGVMRVMLEEGIPIAFGVLTTRNRLQALERAGGSHGNKGEEAAWVAIEMAQKIKK